MNAYELADWFDKDGLVGNMLRQQANRIAELEGEVSHLKHINKNWSISEGWALQRIAELEKEAEECWCQGHSYEYLRAKNRLPQTKPTPEGLIDPKSYYIGYEDGKKAPQTKCLDCGKVNPAEIHTCSPQTRDKE